ncbi:hypothetical protein Phum_PHUM404580 [Pediculus humanus corporis]|uniref:MATH domain-containing protein n=1 Tax=Pediculus humanus subsp. corporis TaxID=121224 RepID=E0VRT9_PEDHC|nr:uncharacterized protein Phum_PHUM404580 [Pediculus humanus corporis]EEB16095.1 hypothetical protein Phum_PHUM404580 [Pediculus humanus corporis]
MALLYRFVKIQDRTNTHVFTFVVTKSVTRDLERDITSKEFMCGYQKWAITFSRTDKVLGVFLVWRNASEGMRLYIDFTFTILNREHFSVNESFTGKQIKFTYESPAHGNRNYIPVNDLYKRNFTDTNGEFQLELTLGNVRTIYETHFRVPHSIFSTFASQYQTDHHHHHSFSSSSSSSSPSTKNPLQTRSGSGSSGSGGGGGGGSGGNSKFESTYFTFGGFDWNITLYPHSHIEPYDHEKISFYLNRLTGFDHQCRIRYVVNLGEGEKLMDSGIIENVSDIEGKVQGWHPRVKFEDLVRKGIIKVRIEMIAANTISEVNFSFKTNLTSSPNIHPQRLQTESLMASPQVAQCYDRDKQGWTLKTDCHSDMVRLHMVYKDIHNVPRNHLRIDSVPLPGSPFSHYYAQENADEGIMIETNVTIKELKELASSSLSEKSSIRIQIEWCESYLLFQANYHKYDDMCRTHSFQMSLERQLFSYQKSISYAHSRRTFSDVGTPEGIEEEYLPYYKERNYSFGDRSLSTDTEYA